MCFSDFPLLFAIFVAMLEKNEIIQSALHNLKIEELNPMQEASLEQATGRKDVILLSPTGSGKTLAYLLPLLWFLHVSWLCRLIVYLRQWELLGRPVVATADILSRKKRRVYQAIIPLLLSVLRDVLPTICLKEISIPKRLKL